MSAADYRRKASPKHAAAARAAAKVKSARTRAEIIQAVRLLGGLPGVPMIADRSGYSNCAVRHHLHAMEAAGEAVRVRIPGAGRPIGWRLAAVEEQNQ